MLDTLFSTSVTSALTIRTALTVILSALFFGLMISLVYIRNNREHGYASSFVCTLIMLPAIIAVIILLVGNNVARAFSLAGAFSLIRFRSAAGSPRDIAYVFFTLAVGLACGMGFIAYAALFAAVLSLAIILLSLSKFGIQKDAPMKLRITLPEDQDYLGLFDDVFQEYTLSNRLQRVKTVDFGSLFELSYQVRLKDGANGKQFIDQLRCRNGNLRIILTAAEAAED